MGGILRKGTKHESEKEEEERVLLLVVITTSHVCVYVCFWSRRV